MCASVSAIAFFAVGGAIVDRFAPSPLRPETGPGPTSGRPPPVSGQRSSGGAGFG
ncbi:hypothetical protein ACIQF6_01485 [Kitasatospora sp. NPDC092948]|uniref:hypothetical protein n=1 Tax=Kitasatospora sp. NPDC092948 TaxID=3364088 RepID=UPI003810474E